jgi:signal peptidase I
MTTSWTRTLKRAGRFAGNVLLVVTVLACAAWLAPSLFGYQRYVITGGSMSGTFEKGSLAFEKPVPVSDLQPGDVITYLPPPDSGVPNLVTHRILAIEPGEDGSPVYTTKGDANPDPDPWHFQLAERTQPVVQVTVPWLGYAFIALADRQTRMLILGGPAAVIALLAMVELVRGLGQRDVPSPGAGEQQTPADAAVLPQQPVRAVELPHGVPASA